MNKETLKIAYKLCDEGSVRELYELIKPFIEKEDPYALNFLSSFSLCEWNETDEAFDERSTKLKIKAAEGGVVEAMYQVAVCYFNGEGVPKDFDKAQMYMQEAALNGHADAQKIVKVWKKEN
jgi:TPR repeat protein